jgi:hypothetical protein
MNSAAHVDTMQASHALDAPSGSAIPHALAPMSGTKTLHSTAQPVSHTHERTAYARAIDADDFISSGWKSAALPSEWSKLERQKLSALATDETSKPAQVANSENRCFMVPFQWRDQTSGKST